MFNSSNKVFFISSLLLLIAILAFFIHKHNLAVYTANLDTRPLNAGVCRPVNSMEPANVLEHQERLIASTIYEGLICYDAKSGELQPRLARKWKCSPDCKNLTINLKENIKFHNGKKLTAAEVKSAWEKSFKNSKEWSSISLFLSIVGSNAMLEGHKQEISGIQVINDGTLKIVFNQPNAAFTYMLTSPIFWVYDSSVENSSAPGTGPYLLKENPDNKDKDILLLRNEKYHRGMPRLTAINFKIYDDELKALEDYKTGELDYLDSIPFNQLKAIKKDPQYKELYLSRPLLNTYSLVLHVNKQPFVDGYLLRRALNYAIDRKAINDSILGGAYTPARGVVPSGFAGYKSNMSGYNYDPEKARQLLEDAGYLVGDQFIPLLISYDNDEGHQAVMEVVAQQLNQVGISVEFSPMEWDYYKKQLGKMQIACGRVSWYADYPDPDNFLYSMFHSSKIGVSNFSAYHNPQVDKLLDLSRKQVNPEERLEYLHQAEEIIVDDAPCLWLFQKCAHKLIGENVSSLSVDNMEMIDWYQVELRKPDLDNGKDKSVKERKKV